MRLRIFLALSAALIAYLWWRSGERPPEIPPPQKALESPNAALLQAHPDLMPEQVAVLLLRQEQEALPAARTLEPAGVPFTITGRIDVALKHRVVFIPSEERPVRLTDTTRGLFKRYVGAGGILVLQAPAGSPWTWLTGVESSSAGRRRKKVSFRNKADPALSHLKQPEQRWFLLGADKPEEAVWTHGLKPLAELGAESLADFPETGEAAVVRRRLGLGVVYTLGLDLRDAVVRPQAQRHFDAGRSQVNGFEPAADIWPLFFRGLYEGSAPFWARLRSEPGDGPLWLMTHSIGPGARLGQVKEFTALESARGAKSTWFVETRTGRDSGNAPFFDNKMRALADQLRRAGFEVASHGVSHAADFAELELGGGEQAKDYRPETDEDGLSDGATLLGEAAVSKGLLDAALSPGAAVGFRGPAFGYPTGLDEALTRSGYRYDSTLAANACITHFPFRMLSGRAVVNESPVVEFPITFEDELPEGKPPPVSVMLAIARRISSYGGAVVWDIRPDGQPSQPERLAAVLNGAPRETSWMTMGEAASFWDRRSQARFSFKDGPLKGEKLLTVRGAQGVGGLSFALSRPARSCSSKVKTPCRGTAAAIDAAVTAVEAQIRIVLE
ncbi:MAG: hypothetical protein HY077_11815 [Elusimicrobia bacterium]|nr:hypothetical protein [Elusimicrobiota bacterium]